jgi:hypothetical protein
MQRRILWVVAFVLASSTLAVGQETTTGSITGQVVDDQGGVIPGATVTLTSAQGTKTFVTDENGRFFAPFLTPGRYAVRVELGGFSPLDRKEIEVRLGQRIEIPNLVLRVGGLQETVEVVGGSPVIDTSSTTAGGVLDSDALKHIPVGRQLSDTLYLVPGVSSSGQVGQANPSIAGGSGLENQYIVDGVNITNTGYGALGSYSIVFGSLGTGVTYDFIKETQVKTAGFEAEYGQATGGVVNVVTQSGTNEFHGAAYGYLRPDFLEDDYRQLTTENGTVNRTASQFSDFGISVNGPVLKDRIFFFAAFNPQFQRTTFVAPEGFPLRELGELDRERRILSYAGKLTYQINGNHRLDASFFGDPAEGENGPQRITSLLRTDTAGFSELAKYGGHNQVLKYDGILTPNWLVEASAARATNTIEEVPSVDEWSFLDSTVTPNVRSGGIGFYEVGNDGENLQFQLKSTNIVEAFGNHQIRYGAQFEDIRYDNVIQRTGPTFTLPDGSQTVTGAEVTILPDPTFGRVFRVTRANTGNVRPTEQRYWSFFLQDTWQIGKRLTLRPGIRYEQQKLIGSDSPALCHEGDSRPGAGDGPGAAIPCEFQWDGNWGPRIGAVYDPFANGKAKIYANWGRFYAKIPNDLAARALSADAGVARADYFDAGLTQPIPEGVLAAEATRHFIPAGLGAAIIDPDSKSTYQDEFVGGVEVEALRGLNVGVRYVYRTMPRVLEDVGTAAFVLYDLGVPGLESVEYFITNPRDGFPPTVNGVGAFEDPIHRYHAVEVTANRSFSENWSLVASYRWSRLRGTFEGFFRNDNGQSDPAITSLFDFPTNDPTYTQIGVPQFGYRGDVRFLGRAGQGPLPNDRTHQFKVFGNRAIGGLNLGVGFFASSGRPLTPMAANPNYDSDGEIPEAPRGSGIETVDGFRERTPWEVTFDVHADYAIRFGERRVVVLADVFNLFNREEPIDYDQNTEIGFQVANPDFGSAKAPGGFLSQFQTPRQVRVGLRFEW